MGLAGSGLVLAVVLATLLGGVVPLTWERHSRVFLAFSAGTLVGLALGELVPEGLGSFADPHQGAMLVLLAFVTTMALDKLHILHPHPHGLDAQCPTTEHTHPPLAMHGAVGLLLHSGLDGLALAAAWREGLPALVAVATALSAHKFADGLTTVSLVLSHHHRRSQATQVLLANAGLLLAGFFAGLGVPVPEEGMAWMLLALAGFFLYLGASDLIPSLTTPRCRKRDVVATALGVAAVVLVSVALH
ncbi:hypothetical protein HRbin09_02133 [bacterium HR09]|nr:hypothetical protein HRbin09_02133 [bacterium HR09]